MTLKNCWRRTNNHKMTMTTNSRDIYLQIEQLNTNIADWEMQIRNIEDKIFQAQSDIQNLEDSLEGNEDDE